MKILWIVSSVMKEIAERIGGTAPVSGTWIEALKENLKTKTNIELHILCVTTRKRFSAIKKIEVDGVNYYILTVGNKALKRGYNKKDAYKLNDFISYLHPDLIHVHGTEFSTSLNIDNINETTIPICHSVQGLVSTIAEKYFYGGMQIQKLSPLVRIPLKMQRHDYYKRGLCERKIIKRFRYFLGRTDWDYSHIMAINSEARYYKEREMLREPFLKASFWDIKNVNRHTIFYGGGARVPLKGFHVFLEALQLIKKNYPNVVVYVAGIVPNKRLPILGKVGYGRYIDDLIVKKELSKNVIFTGVLSAEEMIEKFQTSHCFVMGSAIENSSNTLVEAMTVGTPTVVADVGGLKNFAIDNETSYIYRYEEPELLALYISKIFEDDNKAQCFSIKSRENISKLLANNQEDLLCAYSQVLYDFKKGK